MIYMQIEVFSYLLPFNNNNDLFTHSYMVLIGWLVGWVLWHINLCRLFNAKSIFMKIVLFQTIQFRISMEFKCKYRLIVKNISILSSLV